MCQSSRMIDLGRRGLVLVRSSRDSIGRILTFDKWTPEFLSFFFFTWVGRGTKGNEEWDRAPRARSKKWDFLSLWGFLWMIPACELCSEDVDVLFVVVFTSCCAGPDSSRGWNSGPFEEQISSSI